MNTEHETPLFSCHSGGGKKRICWIWTWRPQHEQGSRQLPCPRLEGQGSTYCRSTTTTIDCLRLLGELKERPTHTPTATFYPGQFFFGCELHKYRRGRSTRMHTHPYEHTYVNPIPMSTFEKLYWHISRSTKPLQSSRCRRNVAFAYH